MTTRRNMYVMRPGYYSGCIVWYDILICFNDADTVQAMVSIERTFHYSEKVARVPALIPC